MKREKRHRVPWYVPPPPPAMATIQCRSCGASLTGQLRRLDDSTVLASKELTPLVPAGCYWPVAADHLPTIADDGPVDFTGCYAVQADELIGVGNHPDRKRWTGCCGPSGTGGLNRICSCGRAVGTERSDCMWPVAVYLDPQSDFSVGRPMRMRNAKTYVNVRQLADSHDNSLSDSRPSTEEME